MIKKLIWGLLLFAGMAQAQVINFADQNFRIALLVANTDNAIAKDQAGNNIRIDTNFNEQIEFTEALAVYQLDMNPELTFATDITSTGGLENFSNLRNLSFYNNTQLADFSVEGLSHLQTVDVHFTAIATLDFSGLTELTFIEAGNSPLTSLNVSGCTALQTLNCIEHLLTELDASNLPSLTTLDITTFQPVVMETLNTSNCPLLTTIEFGNFNQKNINISNCTSLSVLNQGNSVGNDLWETFNASGCTALLGMDSSGSENLTSMNFSGCSAMTTLVLFECALTSLDFTGCSALDYLHVAGNELTTLNLSDCTALEYLYANFNQLSTIEFGNHENIIEMVIGNNPLTSLDMSGCANIFGLECYFTNLETLDVSMCPSLQVFHCNNNPQLEYLNMKNGKLETELLLNDNPSLAHICADDFQLATVAEMVPAAVVNDYCTFVPGGSYNTMTGKVRFDVDNNGCSVTDVVQPFIKVKIYDGQNENAVFTNSAGDYTIYRTEGTYTLSPAPENGALFDVNPGEAVVDFPVVDNSVATNDFCLSPAGGVPHNDLEIAIAQIIPARPGFDAVYKIVYKNNGNQIQSGYFQFEYNEASIDFVTASQPLLDQSPGILGFAFNNLVPFESRSVTVKLHINSPVMTPPVVIGDVLDFTAWIYPTEDDMNVADNTFAFPQTVIGSYDPNNKICAQGAVVSPVMIGEYLHYTINFENTGTAVAENVVVRDVIDPEMYDIGSMQILDSSHPTDVRLNGPIAEFIFQNIQLETGGHGNILLKIKSKSTLVENDMVSNKADIYFDYNHPVITDPAITEFRSLGTEGPGMDASVTVYPNPTHDFVHIKTDGSIQSLQLYDAQGRLLVTRLINEPTGSIDLSSRAKGMYFLKITSDKGMKIEKIMRK